MYAGTLMFLLTYYILFGVPEFSNKTESSVWVCEAKVEGAETDTASLSACDNSDPNLVK